MEETSRKELRREVQEEKMQQWDPESSQNSSDYLDILFDYFLFLNPGSARVLLTNCYLI